jgi:hypothetical protein
MKRTLILSSICSLVMMATVASAPAQEVEASVSVNDDRLPLSARQEVTGFAEEMQRYINSTRWTSEEWDGDKVKMNISVVFDNISGDRYSARMLVGSQRNIYKSTSLSPMMKIMDADGWSFRYSRNQPFQQDVSRFDDLTGLIDFYVYIALGLDLDSYGYLGGSQMYERARQIAQRAQVRTDVDGWSTQETPGSYSRFGLVRELADLRFNPIRRFIFNYHYNGLDLLAEQRAAALDSINNSLSELVKAKDKLVEPSTIIRVLNDAKNTEYAELFTGYSDPLVWRKLLYIDPTHQAVYEAARGQ